MIFDWPDWLRHQEATLVPTYAQVTSDGVFGSGDQTLTHPGSRWAWDMTFGAQDINDRAQTEAFFLRLSGMEHRVRMFDAQLETPQGTCRMQGVTLRAAVAQWATVLPLSGCGVRSTLEAGDWLGCFGQVFRVVASAQANAAGDMDVEVRHSVRAASIAAGTPVVLDRPAAIYGLADSIDFPRVGGRMQPSFRVRLIERFA